MLKKDINRLVTSIVENNKTKKIPIEERICKICQGNIEDEMHFLCYCPLYEEERRRMMINVNRKYFEFRNLNMEEKFIFLMENCYKEVAEFLYISWNKRKMYIL